jgi:hypothetical protein
VKGDKKHGEPRSEIRNHRLSLFRITGSIARSLDSSKAPPDAIAGAIVLDPQRSVGMTLSEEGARAGLTGAAAS